MFAPALLPHESDAYVAHATDAGALGKAMKRDWPVNPSAQDVRRLVALGTRVGWAAVFVCVACCALLDWSNLEVSIRQRNETEKTQWPGVSPNDVRS